MVGSPSSRKVARAARTSSGRRRSASAPIGWYTTIAIIAIAGIALVTFSRQQRLDATNPGTVHPYAPVAANSDGTGGRAGDNWFEAYGVYICDKFVANINSTKNPFGINTSNDGVIHISPFEKKYAGHNATLGLFGKAVDLKVTRTSVQVPGDPKTYKAGEKCGDKDGKFVVKEWTDVTKADGGTEVKSDPSRLLLKDKAAVTIAYVPSDMDVKDIPLPDSAKNLDAVAAAATAAASGTTGDVGDAAGAGDAPATTAPTTPATTAAP